MIRAGEVYRFEHAPYGDVITFVVLKEVPDFRMSEKDEVDRPGYEVLIIDGALGRVAEARRPGEVFRFGKGSPIAIESVRFPREE